MRVLLIHSDYLKFEVKRKAIKTAEEFEEKAGMVDNVLISFIAVEKADEKDPKSVTDQLVDTIIDLFKKVNAETIAVYPYAHLSSDLGSPKVAQEIINDVYDRLKDDYKTIKAPFGWYKSFEIKCKGHPLSELSRTILPTGAKKTEDVSAALKGEEKIKSYWHVMTPDGKLHEVDEFDYKGHERLKKFAVYETAKRRDVDKPPPHIELMRRLELVDYEPASDGGNLRYYPKGRMIKALIEQYVTDKILEYGGVEVETPLMYDFDHPSLSEYLNRFPARQYTIESDNKKYFMRFAACFGQFLMAHDATLSYRCLPLRLYELARYAFRREKSGELAGLRRLRAFTMPDVHAICTDMEQAMEEYKRRLKLCIDVIEGVGLTLDDIEPAVRVTKEFYEKNTEFVKNIVKTLNKPALIEMWDERIFYFILKYEFNFVDALDKASCLSTDQIDVENGQRYGIDFVDKDGKKKYPVILHCSPSGAIERIIYALLEKADIKMKKGEVPMLPVWLSPTHVRVLPVSEEFLGYAKEVAEDIGSGIRVDVDDRPETLGAKIRDAEKEWIPYIAVVGEKEMKKKNLTLRTRGKKGQSETSPLELRKEITAKIEGKPFRPLPLPLLISKRPKFVG